MKDKIIINKAWRSEIKLLIGFFMSVGLTLFLSDYLPGLVINGSLFSLGDNSVNLSLPLLWFIPAAFLAKALFNIYNVQYSISADGVESREGIITIAQSIMKIRFEDIRSVELDQHLLARTLNFGNISLGTAALGRVEIVLKDIASPAEVQELIENERDRRQKLLVREYKELQNNSKVVNR